MEPRIPSLKNGIILHNKKTSYLDPRKQKPIQSITTPSQNPYYTEYSDLSTQRPSRKYQYKECRKNDDEEGYPLSDFEENTIPSSKNMIPGKHCNPFRVKPECQSSDSDGDESNDDTYTLQKPSNTTLDLPQQVNDVLSKLVEHQAAMQDKNLKGYGDVSKSFN